MKNKILLGSVTVLSALMVAACGNGEKKATETTAAPTTEVTTATPTTATPTTTAPTTTADASSEVKKIPIADTQRVGTADNGYVNVPKDWIEFKDPNSTTEFQYASKDAYNIVTLNALTKDKVELGSGETFGAQLIANRLYDNWKGAKEVDQMKGVKTKFAGEEGFLIKLLLKDGKYFFQWIFQKGDKVYTVGLEGTLDTMNSMRPLLQDTWGLDPKTPGQ